MSSCSRTRSERRRARAAALLLAVLAVPFPGRAAAAAPVPLPVAAVLVDGADTALVVDLSAGTRPGRRSVAVTLDGVPQKAELVPVVADDLAVALVVDTSTAGAAALPAWLSAAARFALEAPAGTQAVVIDGATPATVTIGPQRGPSGVVRGLSSVRAHGERDTAAAIGLAVRQFPAAALGRRVVVLYTTGPDAGGERAAALAARVRASGTILVVVGTTAGGPYWADVAAATGGFFAPAGDPVVIPALDQVRTTLRGRHLVRFPTPPVLPSRVSVRITTGDLSLAGDAVVSAEPAPAPRAADRSWLRIRLAAAAALALAVLIATVATIVLRQRRRPPRPSPPDPPPRWVARGRATVPGSVAQGRAHVPETSPTAPE